MPVQSLEVSHFCKAIEHEYITLEQEISSEQYGVLKANWLARRLPMCLEQIFFNLFSQYLFQILNIWIFPFEFSVFFWLITYFPEYLLLPCYTQTLFCSVFTGKYFSVILYLLGAILLAPREALDDNHRNLWGQKQNDVWFSLLLSNVLWVFPQILNGKYPQNSKIPTFFG